MFRIAGTGRQVRRESGRVLYEAGQRASDLEFLLDGSVTVAEANGAEETLNAPAALGFEEVFENVPQRATMKASGWRASAERPLAGTVAASDAFFPFRDGLDAVAAAGATAVVQPGGSVRDAEVIAAADEHGLAMVFTGRRHFRH